MDLRTILSPVAIARLERARSSIGHIDLALVICGVADTVVPDTTAR